MTQKTKLFVFGDIHSYYDEFIEALNKTEYDENNPNHLLVSLGDNFDRGNQSQEVLDFLNNHPNMVLIRGNHEDLIMDCIERAFPRTHDFKNGTVKTIAHLGGFNNFSDFKSFEIARMVTYEKINNLIFSMKDYYETENYIFVHSWIPILHKYDGCTNELIQYYDTDWRYAHADRWYEARWGNPFTFAESGLNKTGKTIVFGHWHTSWWRKHKFDEDDFSENANFDMVFMKKYKSIGIDACTAYSNKVNILVLEDNLLEEQDYELHA